MQRTAINPWEWSRHVGFNQGEIVEGASRHLIVAGQTATDAEGQPQHEGDMRAQMTLALSNLEAVLAAADMDLADVVRLNIATTDMDETMRNFDVLGARLGPSGNMPPQTVLGVTRLALPELMFEIEATAYR